MGVRGSNPLGSTSLRRSEALAEAAAPELQRRRANERRAIKRSGYGSASHSKMRSFHYVYILESRLGAGHFYVGLTEDLKNRLVKHNAGEVPHTSKFRPWRIKTAIAFTDSDRAAAFERYLKSGSGRAFVKRHF